MTSAAQGGAIAWQSMRRYRCRWVLAALFALLPCAVLAQKGDVIYLESGNVLTGEVKKLQNGVLEVSLDHVRNRLSIKWQHVVGITTKRQHDIALVDGTHYLGALVEAPERGQLRIQTKDDLIDVDLLDVVFIEPIHDGVWKRLDGSFSTGLSASKSTSLVLLNLGLEGRYRTVASLTTGRFSTFSHLDAGQLKTNSDLVLNRFGIYPRRWLSRGNVTASRNDELGVRLRGGVGLGGARAVIASNRLNLWLSGMLSGNREYSNDGRQQNNLEAVFESSLLAFRYDTPQLEAKSDLSFYANLTTPGRYRVNFDGRISLELLQDFFWDIGQIYYRFDNEPSTEAVSTSDYGIVTGLRYKF